MRIDPADHHLHDDEADHQLDGGAQQVDKPDDGNHQQVAARIDGETAQVKQQRDKYGLDQPGAGEAGHVEAEQAWDDAPCR